MEPGPVGRRQAAMWMQVAPINLPDLAILAVMLVVAIIAFRGDDD